MSNSPEAAGLRAAGLVLRFAGEVPLLSVPALSLPPGAVLGIAGPSGAGKTSLLHVLCGIERPAAGSVRWDGVDLAALRPAALDRWRRERLGLVFQDHHLFDGMTALNNVLLPVRFDHLRLPPALRGRAEALLARLGVAPGRVASAMSRGERQRVAIARALLRRPAVLVADEPTASLDAVAAAAVGALLLEAAAEAGAAVILASHDGALLARADRRLALRRGVLEEAA